MGSNANLILKKKNRTKLKSTNHFDDKSFFFVFFFAFFFSFFLFFRQKLETNTSPARPSPWRTHELSASHCSTTWSLQG